MKSFKEHIAQYHKAPITCVFAGRFQLPHKGHKHVFDYLHNMFPETFLCTSNKVELPKSPFTFEEKRHLLEFAGIPNNRITQTRIPNLPVELTSKMSDNAVLVIGAGAKVQEEENRFPFKTRSDGSLGYYQPYESHKNDLKPYTQHAYIVFFPTFKFKVLGTEVKSASELRNMFKSLDYKGQIRFITDLYGHYSEPIHHILSKLDQL